MPLQYTAYLGHGRAIQGRVRLVNQIDEMGPGKDSCG